MQTFFSRHTKDLNIDDESFDKMWQEDLVGIHYPSLKKHNSLPKEDTKSLNPNKYDRRGKRPLNALLELSNNGGYVCAHFSHKPNLFKVGFVPKGNQIKLWNCRWRNRDRKAILKVVKLQNVKVLKPVQSLLLSAVQPRGGTFCRWRKVGDRVKRIVEEENIQYNSVKDLTPDQQEVLCYEYLNIIDKTKNDKLPTLECLLSPIGRTLKKLDIVGITENGKKIAAQVTHLKFNSKKTQKKLDAVAEIKALEKDTICILFCRSEKIKIVNGIIIYPLQQVFDEFANTNTGKLWLNNID